MTATDHVRWLSNPTLQSPVVIAGFHGWNDAADAASTAIRTLIEAWHAEPLAEIDPEEFTDFATVRPNVVLDSDRTRRISWPSVNMWHASTPGTDVILILGPEPSLKWRLFSEQILTVAMQFDASMILTMGALLADVPHFRDAHIFGTASEQETMDRYDLQRSRYEGPTGILSVISDACFQSNLPAVSLWAAVPAYASQIPSPKAASALIKRAGEIIGTPAPLGALHNAIVAYEEKVNEMMEDDEDLAEYVQRLDQMGDDAFQGNADQLPFDIEEEDVEEEAAILADEVEQFLREQDN